MMENITAAQINKVRDLLSKGISIVDIEKWTGVKANKTKEIDNQQNNEKQNKQSVRSTEYVSTKRLRGRPRKG